MNAEYRLTTHWRVRGTREEVAAILRDPRDLPHWWPEVCLAVDAEDDGEDGWGTIVHIHSRGRLPFTLRWSFRVMEERWPEGAMIEAWGDLVGHGRWILVQEGAEVRATYVWEVRAEKPMLRLLSPLLKPLFAWNHRWAMAKGEAGLRRELARRRVDAQSGRRSGSSVSSSV